MHTYKIERRFNSIVDDYKGAGGLSDSCKANTEIVFCFYCDSDVGVHKREGLCP